MRTNCRVSPFYEKILVRDKKPYRREYVCQYLIEKDEEHGFTYRYRFIYRITYTPKRHRCIRQLTLYKKILTSWEIVSLGFYDFNPYIKNRFMMQSTAFCKRVESSIRRRKIICGFLSIGMVLFLLI